MATQFIWETDARKIIDFSPGAGTLLRAGLMMHCKGIAICHNQAHEKTLRRLLVDYVVADLSKKRELSKFAPPDMRDRFNKAKPERLIQHESQTNTDNPAITAATATTKRRAAMADTAAEDLAALLGEAPAKKAKPTPKSAGVPAPVATPTGVGAAPPSANAPPDTPPSASPSGTPAGASEPPNIEKPVEDLAAMLAAFGGSNK